jgi:hypothetical protein
MNDFVFYYMGMGLVQISYLFFLCAGYRNRKFGLAYNAAWPAATKLIIPRKE